MTHGLPHMAFDDWLIGLVQYLIGIVFTFMFGRIAHELTHVLVANVLGLEVTNIEINLFSGHVEYQVEDSTPRWKPRIVNAAPQIIGIVIGFPALVYVTLTQGALVIFLAVVLWFAYAGLGSAGDLIPRAARGDGHLWHPTKAEQLGVVALGLLAVSFIVGMMNPDTPYFGPFIAEIQFGFAIAALGVLGMSVLEYKPETTT